MQEMVVNKWYYISIECLGDTLPLELEQSGEGENTHGEWVTFIHLNYCVDIRFL